MGYIYKITNTITNKCYIGQTTQDLCERWRQHKQKKSNCSYLKSAFIKYGIKNFEFKLLCIGFDDKLNDLEIYYINKYNTIVPNGYNLRAGGNNGGKHNEETKKKISQALKGRPIYHKPQLGKPHTEEIKMKIGTALKGLKKTQESIDKRLITISNYDKTKRDEINNKISNTMKGNVKTSKIVEKYDLNDNLLNTFLSITDAANNIGVTRSSIRRCCEGKYKNVKGYIWKYKV